MSEDYPIVEYYRAKIREINRQENLSQWQVFCVFTGLCVVIIALMKKYPEEAMLLPVFLALSAVTAVMALLQLRHQIKQQRPLK